jgi:hypothetical protein
MLPKAGWPDETAYFGRDPRGHFIDGKGLRPPMKQSDEKRRLPPVWVIFSLIAFLALVWTALRIIYAMWRLGQP